VFHVDVASVSETCCKCLFKMFHLFFRLMFASVFDLVVTYVSHILQEYVPMISTVSVLCCSNCFHVTSCKCFIWMLRMFHTYG
jgi:hypothetical protein